MRRHAKGRAGGAFDAVRENYNLGERNACRIVGRPRATPQYVPILKPDEGELTRNIVLIASNYGRYNWRRVTTQKWLPRSSASGCRVLARRAGTVSPDRLGTMAPVNRSTASSGTSTSMAKSSTVSGRREGVIGQWRTQYNARRPHLAPGYRPPAPRTITPPPALYETEYMQ